MTERLSRTERRRIEKDDALWVGKPLAIDAVDRALQAKTRHLAQLLRDARTPRRASRAAVFAGVEVDQANTRGSRVSEMVERLVAAIHPTL